MTNDKPVDDVLDIVKQFVNFFEDVEEKINTQDEEVKSK